MKESLNTDKFLHKKLSAIAVFYAFEDGKKMHTSAIFYFYFPKSTQIKFHIHCVIFILEHCKVVQLRVFVIGILSVYYSMKASSPILLLLHWNVKKKKKNTTWSEIKH